MEDWRRQFQTYTLGGNSRYLECVIMSSDQVEIRTGRLALISFGETLGLITAASDKTLIHLMAFFFFGSEGTMVENIVRLVPEISTSNISHGTVSSHQSQKLIFECEWLFVHKNICGPVLTPVIGFLSAVIDSSSPVTSRVIEIGWTYIYL